MIVVGIEATMSRTAEIKSKANLNFTMKGNMHSTP